MSDPQSVRSLRADEAAMRDDIGHIIGDVDDLKAAEILALKPTVADLEEAAIWLSGDGDVLAKDGHKLGDIAAQILDMLDAPEEGEEDVLPPPA
jgi:hypothetical protein